MLQQNQSHQPTNQAANQPSTQNANPNTNSNNVIQFSRPLPPTLLRINADNQDKRAICIFWVIFFVVIIAITVASSLLPRATFTINNQDQLNNTSLEGCNNPSIINNQSIIQCNPNSNGNSIGTIMLNLQKLNQFVIVYWRFLLKDNNVDMNRVYLGLNSIYGAVVPAQNRNFKISQAVNSSSNLTVAFRKSFRMYSDDGQTLLGYQIPVFVVRDFQQQSDIIITQLNQTFAQIPNISKVQSQIQTVNPSFTRYTLVIRYLFFASSLIACVIYLVMFKKIPVGERLTQQKMIGILSVLLVFFNDPFYPITILQPNKASSYFSVFFVINFAVFLVFLWIIFLDRIYYQDGQKQTQLFNWKRIVYIVVTYIVVLVLYTLIAMQHIEGLPLVQPQDLISNKYAALELIAMFLLLIGFAYIIFSYIRLCMRADQMLWRNQLFLFFSVFFIVITIALFFINGFQINSFAGNRILLLFTCMNMYTFYMQYMYSLSKEDRDRVQRGQVQIGEHRLLQIRSGEDGDCVDLQFDDMPGSKINTDQKLNQFVNRKKIQNQKQLQKQQIYSPKYGKNYQNDLSPKINNNFKQQASDKQTDFFKQNNEQLSQQQHKDIKNQKSKQKQPPVKQQFGQFSLDD